MMHGIMNLKNLIKFFIQQKFTKICFSEYISYQKLQKKLNNK